MTTFREWQQKQAAVRAAEEALAAGAATSDADLHAESARAAVPREARPYQGLRAGIVSRLVANSIDFGVVVVVLFGGFAGWQALQFVVNPTAYSFHMPHFGLWMVFGAFVFVVYFTGSWATTGRTYGDHVMGLRVVNFRGNKIAWPGAFLRALFCTFVMVGILWVAISRENRSVQDVVLRTNVIYDW